MPSITLTTRDTSNVLETVTFNTNDKSATRIQAQQAVSYDFHSDKFNEAPNHIMTKRVGNDLEVGFSKDDPNADLIIENYFDYPESYLIGRAADQVYYYYIPDTGEIEDYVNSLQSGDLEGHALGGEGFATPWWVGTTGFDILNVFSSFGNLADLEFNPVVLLGGLAVGGLVFAGASLNGIDGTTGTQAPQTPQVNDDIRSAGAGETVTIDVLNNDDGGLASADVSFIDGTKVKVVDGEGVWTVNDGSVEGKAKGSITFVPDEKLQGDPTPVEYMVNGEQAIKATVTIDYPEKAVKPEPSKPEPNTPDPEPNKPVVKTKPPVTEDDSGKGEIGQAVRVSVLANDSDPDSAIDPTTVQIVDAGKALHVPNEGVWLVDDKTGDITFEPQKGFTGNPTAIQYTVADTQGNVSNPSQVTITYPKANSQITLVKEAQVPDGAKVGSVIHYTFTIKNTGNLPLTNIEIKDTQLDDLVLSQTDLAVGKSTTAQGIYTLTKADFEAGKVENSATVTAKDPTGKEVTDVSDSANANDGAGDADPTVTLLQPLQPPKAENDSKVGEFGKSVTVNVLANDKDADGILNPSSVEFANGKKDLTVEKEGTWSINKYGKITFTPAEGFIGNPKPVEYTVKDSTGLPSNSATVTVTYPEVKAQLQVIQEDHIPAHAKVGDKIDYTFTIKNTGNVSVTDIVVNNPHLTNVTIDKTDLAVGETATAKGSYTLTKEDFEAGKVVNKVTVTAKDPAGGEIAEVTIESDDGKDPTVIEIQPMQPPVANPDSQKGEIGKPVTFSLVANDSDADSEINIATVAFADGKKELVVDGEGTWKLDDKGNVTFTPEPTFIGNPKPVEYTVKDTEGNISNSATVTVTYPQATAQLTVTKDDIVPDNAKVGSVIDYKITITNSGNLALSDIKVNDDKLSNLTLDKTKLAVGETAIAKGTYTLTKADFDAGKVVNSATVTAKDPAGNEVKDVSDSANANDGNGDDDPTVTPLEKLETAPEAKDDSGNGTIVNGKQQPVTINAIKNDTDAEGDLDPKSVLFSDGSKKMIADDEGTWTISSKGEITFTPKDGFIGNPTDVQYTVKDKTYKESNLATVKVTYPPQDAPQASNDDNVMGEFKDNKQQPVTIEVLKNDTDKQSNLDPTTVEFSNGKTELVVKDQGTWTIDDKGVITFTPQDGFIGNPSPVQYTVKDKTGLQSNEATVKVTYPPQDAPTTTADPVDGEFKDNKQQPVTIEVLKNDTDKQDNLDPTTVKLLDPKGNEVTELLVENQGTWAIDDKGVITFTPVDGFIGNPTPVQYTVKDSTGLKSKPATVTITYPPQTAPDTKEDSVEGEVIGDNVLQPKTIKVLENDSDEQNNIDPKTLTLLDPQGKEVSELVVENQGTWTVDTATSEITFTPLDSFTGKPTDVQYTVKDTTGLTSKPTTVSVSYMTKTPPVATDDKGVGEVTDSKQLAVTIPVIANDYDLEENIDPSSVLFTNGTKELVVKDQGVWTADDKGNITFTPADGFIGNPEPVKYTIKDDISLESNQATVTVTYPKQTAPVANDDLAVGTRIKGKIQPATIKVVENDTDVNDNVDPTSILFSNGKKELTVENQGTWTVDDLTGEIIFTPVEGFQTSPESVEYTVKDKTGLGSNTATVTLTYPDPIVPTIDNTANTTARVSEEGLVNGIGDTIDKVGGSDDTTDNHRNQGAIGVSNAEKIVFTDVQPDMIGNTKVVYDGIGTSTLTAYEDANANGALDEGEGVLKVSISANGSYTADLLAPIDHPDNDNGKVKEDVVSTDFAVKAISTDLKEVTSKLSVAIEDDSPDASAETVGLVIPKQNSNLLLVVDVSGSMIADVEDLGSRLEVTKKALNTLIEEYDKYGDVKVRLVTYSTEGKEQGGTWLSPVQAKKVIDGLQQHGSTNYDDALATAMEAFKSEGRIAEEDGKNVKNLVYFLSDGIPNLSNGDEKSLTGELESIQDPREGPKNPDSGIQGDTTNHAETGEIKEWRDFLRDNDIEAMTVALGRKAADNQAYLDPIAYDGILELVDNPADEGKKDDLTIVTSDLTTLEADLKRSIDPGTAKGNSLLGQNTDTLNTGLGADGGSKLILTINGNTYEYDQIADKLITDISANDKATFIRKADDTGKEANYLEIITDEGALFSVNVDNATYEFTGSQKTLDPYQEVVEYTAIDADGDVVTKTVTFNVSREKDTDTSTTDNANATTDNANSTTDNANSTTDNANSTTDNANATTDNANATTDPTTGTNTQPRILQSSDDVFVSQEQNIDLSNIDNVHKIVLNNDADQTLTLSASDLLDINDDNVLFVDGDRGDVVQSTDVSFADSQVISDVAGYNLYEFDTGSLYLDLDLAVL